MFFIDRRVFTHFDYIFPLLILPIVAISFFLVHELHPALAQKQLMYFMIAFILFVILFIIPIRRLSWLIPLAYWFNILLLLSVEFFGVVKLGAQRWLEIPLAGFTIQPSEIMKTTFILMLAYQISHNPPDSEDGYGWGDFARLSIYILVPFILILKQPDLGTAMIVLFLGYGVLFVVGVNHKVWLSIFGALVLFSPFVYGNLHDYQKKRINDFMSDKPSYHVRQSIIAIGSGGLEGKSKDDATQTHMKFLPIAVSDFIFAFYMERFGFWGGVLLISIYALLILHLLMITIYMKGDYFIQVVSSSIAFLLFLYMGINIAMTVGFAPVVGLPLPLFSHGGSSFITFIMLFAVLENLLTFRYDKFYDSIRYKKRIF